MVGGFHNIDVLPIIGFGFVLGTSLFELAEAIIFGHYEPKTLLDPFL